jgi:hypothetical protein
MKKVNPDPLFFPNGSRSSPKGDEIVVYGKTEISAPARTKKLV